MAEEKKFPTPSMFKAREEWEKTSPEEREAILNSFQEKLIKYYANRFPIEEMMEPSDEEQDD